MSWIDKLEQRVGLRPAPEPERPLTPSERADVAEMSNEAVAHAHALRIVGKELLRDMWISRHAALAGVPS